VVYRASNVITVTTSRLNDVGALIDAAIGAGANRVEGIRFELKDAEPVRIQALELAVQQARAKAQALAKAEGLSIKGVLSIDEQAAGYYPMDYSSRLVEAKVAPSTPIQPGDVTVMVRVGVAYQF